MNIDPTGLEEEFKPTLESIKIDYNASYTTINNMELPSGCNSQYQENIKASLKLIVEDIATLLKETNEFIEGLKSANTTTMNEVNAIENKNWLESGLDWLVMANATQQYNAMQYQAMILGLFNKDSGNAMQGIADQYMEGTNQFVERNILEETGATICNGFVAISKGLCTFLETLGDGVAMANAYNQQNTLIEQALIYGNFDPNMRTALLDSANETMKGTMQFVEKSYTQEAFDALYQTEVMKKINEKSFVKYGDSIYMVIEGVAYYIPIAVLDKACPGFGTTLTFLSGTGKAGEEILKEMKVASKEGIKSEYEAGNISEETYNSYTQIWNMTDEEYMKNVNLAKINGQITEEEYEQMEIIRNMPNEWTTKENMDKAMGVSVASGAWEAAQWIVGKNLNGMNTIGGSKVAASLTRVGIDTAFNAADTPFRSLLASGALNKDFAETFNERGGWQGVGVNAGVGLAGSLFGEVQDLNKVSRNLYMDKKGVNRFSVTSGTSVQFENVTLDNIQRIGVAKQKMKNFFEFLPQAGVTEDEIDKAFKTVTVVETDKAFEDYLISRGFKYEELHNVRAVCSDEDKIFLRPNYTEGDVIHEVNHLLGEILTPDGDVDIDAHCGNFRGINEAYTESLTLGILRENGLGSSGYAYNVKVLRDITIVLRNKGYKNVNISYYRNSPNRQALKDALRDFTGDDEFYIELVHHMNYTDIPGATTSSGKLNSNILNEHRVVVDSMVEKLKKMYLGVE